MLKGYCVLTAEFNMFLPKKVNVARLSRDADNNNKESYSTIIYGVGMDIQPASAELTAVSEGVFGQVYRAFTPCSGIAIGDRVTVSGTSDNYLVKGVDNWNYGFIPHLELTLFRADD